MKHVHRLILLLIFITSLGWACFSLKRDLFSLTGNFEFFELVKLFYVLAFTVIFWPLFYIEIADYFASLTGRNGVIYRGYAKHLLKDIIVSALVALFLGSIYWFDLIDYNFSGIDLGFLGFPFLINAIYTLIQIMRLKVAGKPIKKLAIVIMLAIVLAFTLLSYSVLLKNSAGDFETHQAIFFQLTILFASFFIFTNTNLLLHQIGRGKFELSQFKKHLIVDILKSKNGIYIGMEEPLNKLNKNILQEKAKHSAFLRKKAKRSKFIGSQ